MKKFFSYVLTFVVMFVISAATTVFMSYAGSDGGINPMLGVGGQGANSSFFNGIIGTFEEEKRFSVDGTIEIERDGKKLPVSLYVNVDLSEGDNLKIDGFANIKINNNYKTIEFSFFNNTIYFSFNGVDIKITTATIETLITELSNIISTQTNDNAELGSESGASIIEELMPQLMSALDSMKETKLDNGDKKVNLEIEGLAKVEAITTEDNKPKNVKLETVEISGVKIKADISLGFNKELVIFDPELKTNAKDYFDVKQLYKVIENLTQLRNFNATATVNLTKGNKTNTVALDLLADIDNGNYDINLKENTFGYVEELRATLLNGETYFKLNDLGFYLNENIVNSASDLAGVLLNYVVDDIDFSKVTNKVENIISSIDIEKAFALLKVFKGFDINENGIEIRIDASVINECQGIITINIGFDGYNLKSIEVDGLCVDNQILTFKIEVEEVEREVEITQKDEYLDIYNLYELNKQYFSTNSLSLDLSLKNNIASGFKFESSINLDLKENYFELLSNVNVFGGIDLFVLYDNKDAYIGLNDIKLKTSKDFIVNLFSGIDINSMVAGATESLTSGLNNAIEDIDYVKLLGYLRFIKNIEVSSKGLVVEISGDAFGADKNAVFTIELNNNVLNAIRIDNITINENEFDLDIELKSNVIVKNTEDKRNYLDIEKFIDGAKSIINSTKGTIYANANFTVKDKEYFANMALAGDKDKNYLNLVLALTGDISLNTDITFKNDRLYVGVEEIKVSASKDLIYQLITILSSNVQIDDINLDGLKNNETVKNVLKFINNFKLEDINKLKDIIVTSSHIQIVLDKTIFGAKEDLIVRIELYNSSPREFEISNLQLAKDTNLTIKVSPSHSYVEKNIYENDYLNIDKVIDGVNQFINANDYQISGQINFDNIIVGIDAIASKEGLKQLNLNDSYYSLNANIFANEDYSISVVYDNEVAYLTLNNIKVKLSKTDAEKIINELGLKPSSINVSELFGSIKNNLPSNINIDINSILGLLNNVKISGNNINIKLDKSLTGLEESITLSIVLVNGLIKSIDIQGLNIEGKEISGIINLEINNIQKSLIDKKEYLDVVDVLKKAIALKDLREATINANIDAMVNSKNYFADLYFSGSLDKEYAKLVLALNGAIDLDLSVVYNNETIYANIEDIFVSIGKDFIAGLIGKFNISSEINAGDITTKIKGLAIIDNVKAFVDNFSIESLKLIKEIKINSNEISITLDKSIFGNKEDLTIVIGFTNNNISKLSVSRIDIEENISISLDLAFNQQVNIEKVEENKYLNIDKVVDGVKEVINFNSVSVNGCIGVDNEKLNFGIDFIKNSTKNLDVLKSYISLFVNISDYDISIVYDQESAYIKLNDIKIKISKEHAEKLIEEFGLLEKINNTNIDINKLTNPIIEKLKSYSVLDFVSVIRTLRVVNNEIYIELDGTIFGLGNQIVVQVGFTDNVISSLVVDGFIVKNKAISLDIDLKINETQKQVIEESEYLDALELLKNVVALKDLREATINANIDALINNIKYNATINFAGSLEQEYLKLLVSLSSDKTLDIDVRLVDGKVYLKVKDIWVSVELSTIQSLLGNNISFDGISTNGLVDELLSLEIVENIKNFITNFNLDSLKLIKNIQINSKLISLQLDKSIFNSNEDLEIRIDLKNNDLSKLSVSNLKVKNDIILSLDISLDKNIVKESVEENKYLEIEKFVNNLCSYVEANFVQILGNVTLYEFDGIGFNEKLNVSLDLMKRQVLTDLMGYLKLDVTENGSTISLETNYLKDTIYAMIAGLKIKIDKASIKDDIHTILNMLGMEPTEYDVIIDKVVEILSGANIVDALKEFIDLPALSNNSVFIDVEKILSTVLNGISITADGINVDIDGNLFGFNSQISLNIIANESEISNIELNKLQINNLYIDASLEVGQEDKLLPEFTEEQEKQYLSVSEVVNATDKVYNTLKTGVVSGDITLQIELFGEINTISINYGIKYQNKVLNAYIKTNFKGLDVSVYLFDGIFYIDIVGMKIKVEYNEFQDIIDWLNKEFDLGLNINIEEIENSLKSNSFDIELSVESIADIVNGIDFSFLEDVIINKNSIEGSLLGTTIFVVYDELVKQVTFRKGTMYAELNCTSYDDFAFDKIDTNTFSSYTKLIDAYNSVTNTIFDYQYSVGANAKVVAKDKLLHNINIDLDIDILNTIKIFADVIVEGKQPTVVSAAYQNDVLYANYENLKLSIHQYNLREIMVVALEALGFDASTISFLGDIAENMEIETGNIQNLIPALDFGNPLNMLKLVKSINLNDGLFNITLDGKAILRDEKANDMNLNIKLDEGISYIELLNIYTGKSNGELFNLRIDFKKFTGVPDVEEPETYIDISESSQLIKAFVNTSNLNDYTVTGNLKIVANIIGINIDMDVPVLVNVKIVDGEVVVYAKLDIPVVGSNVPGFTGINVNNDVPYEFGDTSVKSRMLELMIKDGFVYMYRKDVVNQTVFDSRVYEKQLKISTEEFSWGLTDYLLSYGVGLSDQIMAEIDKAFDKAVNRGDNPLDISNVLLGYNKQENADVHQIVINLREIANNELMDKAAIDIHIINNSTTANKDYIGKLVFDMNMPLASGVNMNIKTDDLSLVDIGKAVDMSYVNNFANSYAYKENQQYERSDGGAWEFVGEKKYTIRFVNSKGDAPADIVATVDSAIALPTIGTIVQDKEDGIHTYVFAGWYTTEECKKGTEFNLSIMPRGDRVLYAKWNETVVYKRTISFVSNGGAETNSITALVGATVVLPILQNKIVIDGYVKTTYEFTGWFMDTNCTSKFTGAYMPENNTTLYAGWKEIDRYVAYNLKVVDNGSVVYDEYVGEGANVSLTGFKIDTYTEFYLEQNFTTRYYISTMPSKDLILYVRNKYTVVINPNTNGVTGFTGKTVTAYQGEPLSLENLSKATFDDGKTYRIVYNFKGYDNALTNIPNKDMTINAVWEVIKTAYRKITINVDTTTSAYKEYIKLYKDGKQMNEFAFYVLQGETFDLSRITAKWEYSVTFIWTTYYHYDLQGFKDNNSALVWENNSISTVTPGDRDITIYADWSTLKT